MKPCRAPAPIPVGLFTLLLLASSPRVALAAPAGDAEDPFAEPPASETPAPETPADDSPAVEAPPAPAAIDWSALFDRTIVVVSDGRTLRGRLASHTADTITIVEANGAVSDLAKASVTEAREATTAAEHRSRDAGLDEPPRRRSETAGAAQSAADARGSGDGFRSPQTFVLVAPGALAVPFRAPNPLFYRWGFSVGRLLPAAGSSFAGAYGFTFEHMTRKDSAEEFITVPTDPFDEPAPALLEFDYRTNILRGLAEVRVGSSARNVFGYVLLGAGFSIVHVKASASESTINDTTGGFSVPLGAGIQGLLGDHFVLGFEPRVVVDIYAGAGAAAMFDARAILGAVF